MALLDSIFSIQIVQGAVQFFQRKTLEFAGAGVVVEDVPAQGRTRVTIAGGGGGGGDLTEVEADIAALQVDVTDLQDDMTVVQTMAADHQTRHTRGGPDEIASDVLRSLYVPVNYVRTLVGGLTSHVEHVASHLKGIDDALRALVRVNYVTEAGASHAFVLSDAYKTVLCTSATAVTITIPTNATTAYEIGTVIGFVPMAAGQLTLVAAGGVTLNSGGGELKSARQYGPVFIEQTAANTWLVTGEKVA